MTQLMLVAGTDIERSELSSITFQVTDRHGKTQDAGQSIDASTVLPLTVGVVHEGGSLLGPVIVSATATPQEGKPFTREHEVYFKRGQVLVVPLHLMARCLHGATCSGEEQCSESGCSPRALTNLSTWTGEPPDVPHGDAGSEPTDASVAERDAGAPRDGSAGDGDAGLAMCGGEVVDLDSDTHCGSCENDCTAVSSNTLHAHLECVKRECEPRCLDGYRNCNKIRNDGCEAELATDSLNCGACDNDCSVHGNGYKCKTGQCCKGNDCI